MEWIEWVEPFNDAAQPVYCRVSRETAIHTQRQSGLSVGFTYESDERALADFMTVHWARLVDLPPMKGSS